MGCICSKGAAPDDQIHESAKEKEVKDSSVQLVAPTPSKKEEVIYKPGAGGGGGGGGGGSGSGGGGGRGGGGAAHNNNATVGLENGGDKNTVIVERPKKSYHQRCATMDIKIGGGGGGQQQMTRVVSSPRCADDESNDDWPPWLTSVAGDAIKGWVPRRADSFEKIDKIGQGTYSSVYKARDLETGKIVALKKVRFVNMDPESVRFMAREICILRKLDHPNVMKLEGLVTSRMSNSLYLVFEYMEHDLAGLAATPTIKFTEPQIKCYMQQLLRGLEHCHSRGVLHRDIKGSNLLISNDGVLKIADFGLANFFEPDQSQPLTSRVVTLWYRAPELLLGATEYGPAIDLWSSGCILAELLAGKPIMPGRTEVEQMHKIFKLCGSPSEDFWQKKKFPHATSFKPQQPYARCVTDTFSKFPRTALVLIDKLLSIEPELRGSAASALSSEFFTTEPLPCDPSNFPKYPPSKEMDAKLRDEEARRRKAEAVKGRGPESVRRGSREIKAVPTPEFVAQGQSKNISTSHKYDAQEEGGSGFRIEPPRGNLQNGYSSYTGSMIHPKAAWNNSATSVGNTVESRPHKSHIPQVIVDLNASSHRRDERGHAKDSTTGYMPRKSRIHYSGPLMPPGGNMDDILKEHERQIQHAVRKARLEKSGTRKNSDIYGQQIVNQNHRGKYGR